MKKLCIFTLLTGFLFISGCGTKYSSKDTGNSKIERIAPASAFNQICGVQPSVIDRLTGDQAEHLGIRAPKGYGIVPVDRKIKIVGNIGGHFRVAESDWRIAGAGMLSSDHEHMIAYPRSNRMVVHDPYVIQRIEIRRVLNEVVWK